MLNSGDVVLVDLGVPAGSEAGLSRPAVIITAQRVLSRGPNVVQVVPFTTTLRQYATEVLVEPDEANGLEELSSAQCQHIRALATTRIRSTVGNVGPLVLAQVRDVLAALLDL